MVRLLVTFCVLVGSLRASVTQAQTAIPFAVSDSAAGDAPSSDACSDLSEADAHRLALGLEAQAESGAPAAARWLWGWLAAYAVLAVGQGVIALAIEAEEVRWPAVVGGVSSLLGVGSMLISPVRTHRLPERLRVLAPLTGRARLRAVEREIWRAAEGEEQQRNLVSHALGWGAALGGGLVLWLGFDQLVSGVLNVVASVGVSELELALAPTSARELWRAHVTLHPDAATCLRDGDESSAPASTSRPTFALVPAGLGARSVGVGLVLTF